MIFCYFLGGAHSLVPTAMVVIHEIHVFAGPGSSMQERAQLTPLNDWWNGKSFCTASNYLLLLFFCNCVPILFLISVNKI